MTLTHLNEWRSRREKHRPPPATIHVAITVPDERTARLIKRNVAVLTPKSWPGQTRLHVLIGNKTELDDQMRVLIADLNWVNHEDLDLVYPAELEIGWPNE